MQFIDKTFISRKQDQSDHISHLYSVVTADPTTGELFAPAGPGQEEGGGEEAEGDDGEPGQAAPGLRLQQVEGLQVLAVLAGAAGLGDAEEDRGPRHPADDEAPQGADGDGLVGVVGERPQHGGAEARGGLQQLFEATTH